MSARQAVCRTVAAVVIAATFVVGCAAGRANAATLTVGVADASAGALEDAVVWAMPVAGKGPARPPATVIVDQVARQFVPLVSVIQTGTSISFPNKDNIRHQVYSFSPAKVFDLKLYSGVPSQPVLFDKPGLVVLGCNIHDRMMAFVQVVDTPWFGKSDRSGVVRIEGLPPGDYLIHAWHPRLDDQKTVVQPLKMAADTRVDIVLRLGP